MRLEIKNLAIEFNIDCQLKSTARVNFYRQLYGYRRYSRGGKYIRIKEGILDSFNYIKPTKSTILLQIKDAKILRNYLKKHKCNFEERIVILDKEDSKKLGLNFSNNWDKVYNELKENPDLFFSLDI